MGFCIYCNQNVYSNSTCPKCHKTISSSSTTTKKNDGSTSSRISTMFGEQKKQTIDKWQDTYGKKAIFNNNGTPINRQRMMPQFNSSTTTTTTTTLQQPCPESVSISTPLVSSRSTLTSSITNASVIAANKSNAYFQYQRSRRSSMFNRTNLEQEDGPAPQKTTSTSAIISPPPLLNKIFEGNKNHDEKSRIKSSTPEAIPPVIVPIEPSPQTDATRSNNKKKVIKKKPCKECGQHVSKKDYRGLKVHHGEIICFHSYCLFCHKCHQSFQGLDFCTDGKHFYHTECPDVVTSVNSSRQSTPLSEEEEEEEEEAVYPQTPPPHEDHFDIAVQSPQDKEVILQQQQSKKQHVIESTTTTVICTTCALPVNDNTCLELANQFYHKECLLCAGCNKTVPTDQKLSKFGSKLYCHQCSPSPTRNHFSKPPLLSSSTSTPILSINTSLSPKRVPTITTPSDIFKSRKKLLPRLGGVRTCARCNLSMPFSDTQPGPHASRWHKKCLRCAGCNKQMDSDAHMTVNEDSGLCLVHCRACLDETPKPRFVR